MVIIIVIIIILFLFITKDSFINMVTGNSLHDIAYELGNNYLNKMKKLEYFKMEYPAVMFDIDDTLINLNGKAIKPMIKLLNKCISEGILVIIITARSNVYYNETVNQLASFNIKYGVLYLRDDSLDDINTFKSNIKKKLAEQNDITTIMSIGDNIIDIDGEYSGYWIKLPNHSDRRLYHLNANGESEQIV